MKFKEMAAFISGMLVTNRTFLEMSPSGGVWAAAGPVGSIKKAVITAARARASRVAGIEEGSP